MVRTASTMLPLGTSAPKFSLPNIDGKTVSLADFRGKPLVVMFICNHCPYVKHVAPEIVRIVSDYSGRGVAFVGISSNDVTSHPEDSPEKMREEAKVQGYQFPYLYDESQEIAKTYQAACTPDIFVFDKEHRLVYRGQMDDSRPKTDKPLNGSDLRAALDAVLAGKNPNELQKPSIGCNIKWKQGDEPQYFNPSGNA
jgi:peroxiredoxin